MTLGDLIFVVERKSGLNDSVPDEHTLMLKWANDGLIEVLLETHAVVEIGDMTLQVGVSEYRTDANILAVLNARVTSANQRYDLEVVDLDVLMSRQRTTSTSPTQCIAVEGDLLFVYPTPTAADVLRWIYVPRPASQLVTNADDLSSASFGRLPKEYHRAVEYYMLWQAAEYDDKKFAESPLDLFKQFQFECHNVRKRKKHKRGRQPRVAKVGYPGKRQVGTRNDQDIVY